MTIQLIANEQRQVAVDILTPAAQASTNGAAVITGSGMDMRMWRSLTYTIANITDTITWWVYGANASDYSDEVIVNGPLDVLASAVDSYAVAQAPYGYYRAKIQSKVADTPGTVTLRAIAKG
jgi:hypothetical protein